MPNWLGSVVVAGLLVAGSTGPKLWLQRYAAHADADRLNADMRGRLEALGFATALDAATPATAVLAWRDDCRLVARNGDRARELGVVFAMEAAEYGPVAIGYRGHWSRHPAGARAVMERFAQDGARRIGFDIERPAVVALARSGRCDGVRRALSRLTVHATLKRTVAAPAE